MVDLRQMLIPANIKPQYYHRFDKGEDIDDNFSMDAVVDNSSAYQARVSCTSNSIDIEYSLPCGFDENKLRVSCSGNYLTIAGSHQQLIQCESDNDLLESVELRSFCRNIRLPDYCLVDQMQHEIRDAMLHVHIPRRCPDSYGKSYPPSTISDIKYMDKDNINGFENERLTGKDRHKGIQNSMTEQQPNERQENRQEENEHVENPNKNMDTNAIKTDSQVAKENTKESVKENVKDNAEKIRKNTPVGKELNQVSSRGEGISPKKGKKSKK